MKKFTKSFLGILLVLTVLLSGCTNTNVPDENISKVDPIETEQNIVTESTTPEPKEEPSKPVVEKKEIDISSIPEFSGSPYVAINNNQPTFTQEEITTKSFEEYSPMDNLGRCGVVFSCIGYDLMPTEERGSIGQVKPSGWQTVKYDIVDGKYLYNRCHLIGFQLTGENANERNLITGTRYLNIDGMLPFENMVADYIKETRNHVLYRVTPVYKGNNLVASGVIMEGYSVEDNGAGICYNIYAYNAQPGIEIDYATGNSKLVGTAESNSTSSNTAVVVPPVSSNTSSNSNTTATYVLNKNTKKFHRPSCSSADDIKPSNRGEFTGSRDDVIAQGYVACKRCNP